MSLLALAQEATRPGEMKQDTMKAEKASAKAVSLSGTISADGKLEQSNAPPLNVVLNWTFDLQR